MSSPIGVGDLITIVRLGALIYEKCFTRAQAADERYLQFGEEIRNFSESLDRLHHIINNVQRERQTRLGRNFGNDAQINLTLKPLPDIAGDFVKTLQACERLLSDNSKFRHNAAGFVDNVRWWLGVEKEVESLKQRIRFHTTKILLVTKPIEIQLLLDLRDDIWHLTQVVEDIRGLLLNPNVERESIEQQHPSSRLPPVPLELESRFVAAAKNNTGAIINIRNVPLQDGFDALVFHFSESTVEFVSRQFSNQKTPDLTQYLNLVKSRWLLQMLLESSQYVGGSLWARCIKEIADGIAREYERFDSGQLIRPNLDVITRLQDHCFSIWVDDKQAESVPTLMDERPSEEKLLELALVSSKSSQKSQLLVFRKSLLELRLVFATKDNHNEMFHEATSVVMHLHHTRFIPLYALTNSVSLTKTTNVLFCNSQGQGEEAYSLETLDDVLKLQHAVTGYKVAYDVDNISWNTYKITEVGRGRIQLWRAKSLPRLKPNEDIQAQSPTGALTRQVTSASSFTLAESVAATAKGSLVQGKAGPAVLFSKPDLPMIVLYTILNDRWGFLYFELDNNIYINSRGCNCKECKGPQKMCCRVIIESRSKFKIKRHLADARDGVNTWDLAVLRKSRHQKAVPVPDMTVKYLVVEFPTIEDKISFQKVFQDTQDLRILESKEFTRATSGGGTKPRYY